MIRRSNTPGDSDTRHSTRKPNNQCHKPLATPQETINHNSSSSWHQIHNKPHSDITLNGTLEIKALIDSGSAICFANPSILSYLAIKSTKGPPITVTNGHNHREKTQGCYKATINMDKGLPYPIKNKQVDIHVIDNLSSKLILGADFLKGSGAAIGLNKNTSTPPKGKDIIARYTNPIPRETTTIIWEESTPKENLKDACSRFNTNIPRASKPGAANNTTLGITPTLWVHSNLYSEEKNNTLQITAINTNIHPTEAHEKRSIVGNYAHRPDKENSTGLPIPKANSGIISIIHKKQINEHNPTQYGITPAQDTQTKIIKNQLEQFDTKDVEQGWNPTYQQPNTWEPETQVLDVQSMNEIATSQILSNNQIEQLTTYSTPIFMVAIRNGPNVGQKRFIRDFRDQNIPDHELTIQNVGESSRIPTETKNRHSLANNHWNILHNPPMETSTRTPAPFTLLLQDDQKIRPQLEARGVISEFPENRHRPTSQNVHIMKRNYTITDGSPFEEGAHVTRSREPPIGPRRWTLVRPRPTNSTQWERASPPSTQDEELMSYQPLARKEHIRKGLELNYTQPSVEQSEDTSLQETKQHRRTPAVTKMDDPTTTYHHPLPTIFWRTLIYKSTENPITPNQENTPGAINTFTQYPRMIENSNRETMTLTKTLLDQWMVRHGSYEQSNDPPRDQHESMDIPCPGAHTTIRGSNRMFFRTAERNPHTHAIE